MPHGIAVLVWQQPRLSVVESLMVDSSLENMKLT